MENFFLVLGGIFGVFFLFFLYVLPGVLLYRLGLRFSKKIKNENIKILIQAGLLALAVAPSPNINPHSGVFPAVWMVFFFSGFDRWVFGIIPILIFWGVATILLFWLRLRKRKKSLS